MSDGNQSADGANRATDASVDTERGGAPADDENATLTRRTGLKMAGAAGLGLLAGGSGQVAASSAEARPWQQDVDAQDHALSNLGKLEMSVGGGPIRDFEGENLHIDEGELSASSKVTFHHVDDYGADPTGEEASDAAVDAAIDAAEAGDWIALTNGEYLLEEHHRIAKSVVVYAEGSTVTCTQYNGNKETVSQSAMYDTHEAVIWFEGEKTDRTTVEEDADSQADQIVVDDPSAFSVGDDVLVVDGSGGDPKGWLYRSYQPTRSTVRAIDGNTLFLTTPLKYDYSASGGNAAHVFRLDAVVRPRVVGGTWTGDADTIVSLNYTRGGVVRDVHVDTYRNHAFQTVDSLNTLFLDCSSDPPINYHGSHGEAFRIGGSTDVTIVRPVINRCRRGIDLRSGCKTLRVIEPRITGITLKGFSYHSNSSSEVNGDMEVHGGYAVGSITDPTLNGPDDDGPWEYHGGWIADSTQGSGYAHYYGVYIVSRQASILSEGSDVLLDGCVFETVEPGQGSTVLELSGTNVTAKNCVVHGTDQAYALSITGENVSVDAHIDGPVSEDYVVVGAGATGVDARLTVDGAADGDQRGVVFGECTDVNVHDSRFDVGGQAVAFDGGQATNVSVVHSTLRGSENGVTVGATGAETTLESVHINDNNVDGDVAADAEANGLWIKNNSVDGMVSAPDDEQTFVRDNLTGSGGG